MKRGAIENQSKGSKKPKKTVNLDDVLAEVSNGEYENFIAYVNENKLKRLDLFGKLQNSDLDLTHICTAVSQTPITELSLGSINDERAAILAPLLKKTNVTELGLQYNQIGVRGAKAIAKHLLGKDSKIQFLDLSHNPLKDEGVQAIAEGIKDSALKSLAMSGLKGEKITIRGVKALAEGVQDSALSTLQFSDNQLGDKEAEVIAKMLPNTKITMLAFKNNMIGDKGAIALAEACKNADVAQVYLDGNQIGDAGARSFFDRIMDKSVKLYYVGLCDNPITNEKRIEFQRLRGKVGDYDLCKTKEDKYFTFKITEPETNRNQAHADTKPAKSDKSSHQKLDTTPAFNLSKTKKPKHKKAAEKVADSEDDDESQDEEKAKAIVTRSKLILI